MQSATPLQPELAVLLGNRWYGSPRQDNVCLTRRHRRHDHLAALNLGEPRRVVLTPIEQGQLMPACQRRFHHLALKEDRAPKDRDLHGIPVSNLTSALLTALIDGPKLVRQGSVALWCALICTAVAWALSCVVCASAASTTS